MPFPASGGARYARASAKVIRFARHGCTNRPFFHIVVMEKYKNQHYQAIEQVGTYDPLVNQYNERLVSLNLERLRNWIGRGAHVSRPVAELLGLSGFLPIHPSSYMQAWRARRIAESEKLAEQEKTQVADKTT
ncbi:putative 28S ribosomal protein S16 [Blattella germanica]|nr:putative 28S ribosomal protein S16 [Blattella germanica]